MSPIEHCIIPPPETSTPHDLSPCDTQSNLERQSSSQYSTSEHTPEHSKPSSSKGRRTLNRRNTEPASPRLNTSQTWRPSWSLDLIFTPRPLEVILAERAYLVSYLHRQSMHSRRLIGEYSAIDAEFAAPATIGKTRRRLRKRLGHLRSKLDQAAGQEKSIFVRLGEVYTELQSHAAWNEAALWRIPLQQQHQQGPTFADAQGERYFPGYATPFSPEEPFCNPQNTPLDPTLPVFVPGQPIYASSDSSSAIRFTSNLGSVSTLETVDETSEDESSSDQDVSGNEDRSDMYDYECEDDDVEIICHGRIPHEEGMKSPTGRRLSLPCPLSPWPEE
ncbi:hypothetical protein NLU13_5955 [Sarocladium strictum]|uniref:Uncharacterized protein n=1 Tax=Sarocladium strictum TaxID=5046 RepID=A0AA39L6N0_SARSR|nr:hypothetical protein NLU13_5955 [Sarocladium strictum]